MLQVREVRLAKALESAVAKEQQSRKDKEELELDVQEMSRAARELLAFHERRAPSRSAPCARAAFWARPCASRTSRALRRRRRQQWRCRCDSRSSSKRA